MNLQRFNVFSALLRTNVTALPNHFVDVRNDPREFLRKKNISHARNRFGMSLIQCNRLTPFSVAQHLVVEWQSFSLH